MLSQEIGLHTRFTSMPLSTNGATVLSLARVSHVFVNMVPGPYELTVEANGFKTEHVSGLVLEVDQTLRQDFQLAVGSVAESIEVTPDTQMVQTDNTTLGEYHR